MGRTSDCLIWRKKGQGTQLTIFCYLWHCHLERGVSGLSIAQCCLVKAVVRLVSERTPQVTRAVPA